MSTNVADPLWPALVLLVAAVMAWWLALGARRTARLYVRLAAALEAALAIAAGTNLAPLVLAPLTVALSAVLLAFAAHASFRRPASPLFAGIGLTVGCAAGLAAAFTGATLPAVAPQSIAIVAMLMVARRGLRRLSAPSIELAAGALALLAAAASLLATTPDALVALLLFSAAGLLGVALAVARISDTFVKRGSSRPRVPAIGGFG